MIVQLFIVFIGKSLRPTFKMRTKSSRYTGARYSTAVRRKSIFFPFSKGGFLDFCKKTPFSTMAGCLRVQLYVVGWEKTCLSTIVTEPPILIWEFEIRDLGIFGEAQFCTKSISMRDSKAQVVWFGYINLHA